MAPKCWILVSTSFERASVCSPALADAFSIAREVFTIVPYVPLRRYCTGQLELTHFQSRVYRIHELAQVVVCRPLVLLFPIAKDDGLGMSNSKPALLNDL